MSIIRKIITKPKCRHCGSSFILKDEDGRLYCLICCRPYTDWQEYGALGGQATLARYGREWFREIGRRGGLAGRLPTISELRQQQVPQAQYQLKGGNRLPNNLSELKELWKLQNKSGELVSLVATSSPERGKS